MKLISLSSNKESFNTLQFSRHGLSLIVAKQDSENSRMTYNSVGKSLALYLVHYCFGATPNKDFIEKLNSWSFTLQFEVESELYKVTRAVKSSEVIVFNELELSLNHFKDRMLKMAFPSAVSIKHLTFRSLFSRFARNSKGSYVEYDRPIDDEQKNPFGQLMNNAYLLGISPDLVLEKGTLKAQLDNAQQSRKDIESNPIIKEYFEHDEETFELEVADIKGKITKLQKTINNFQIADNFDEIREEADSISRSLKQAANERAKLYSLRSSLLKSKEIVPDISTTRLLNFYKRARIDLGGSIIARLKEVEAFHKKLLINRKANLATDLDRISNELEVIGNNIDRLKRRQNELMRYLDTHGALDEYTKLNEQYVALEKKLSSITNYRDLLSAVQEREDRVKQKLIESNINSRRYLNEARPKLDEIASRFKDLCHEFYVNKLSSIIIAVNEGVNKQRFDIKAKIQHDAGDGINEVKIFCYDWTILQQNGVHNMNFLFHDSRLTDGVDPRQVTTMFQHSMNNTEYQYITSINEDRLDSVREHASNELKDYIDSHTVLRLSEKDDTTRLLGVQIDLRYN